MKMSFTFVIFALAFYAQSSLSKEVMTMATTLERFKARQLQPFEDNQPYKYEGDAFVKDGSGRPVRYQINRLLVDDYKKKIQEIIDRTKSRPELDSICYSSAYFKAMKEVLSKYNVLYYVPQPGARCDLGLPDARCENSDQAFENLFGRKWLMEIVMRGYLGLLNYYTVSNSTEDKQVQFRSERFARQNIITALQEADKIPLKNALALMHVAATKIVDQQSADLKTICAVQTK